MSWYLLLALSFLAASADGEKDVTSKEFPLGVNQTDVVLAESDPQGSGWTGSPHSTENGTESPHNHQKQSTALERVYYFFVYWVSVVPWLALVLNSLSFFVWAFIGKTADQPTKLFLMALALSDIFSLINLMDFAIFFWTGHTYSFQQSTDVGCKLVQYIANTARNCSSYFILGFTADRFLSIWFPMKRQSFISVRRVAIAMAITVMISAVMEVYMPILLEHHELANRCMVTDGTLMRTLSSVFRNGIGFLLPMILVAVLNGLIIVRLQNHHTISESSTESGRTRKAEARNRTLTMMLVGVSIYSFVVYLPKTIVFYLTASSNNFSSSMHLAFYVVDMLSALNFTCNFFLYCLVMPRFRRVLTRPIRRCLRRAGIGRFVSRAEGSKDDSPSSIDSEVRVETCASHQRSCV